MQINKNQLFVLITLFELGSTTLFVLGVDTVKQDAWLAILIAAVFGFCLLWLYINIQKYDFDKHWGEILDSVLGNWASKPIILIYALYFFYSSALNLYEFGMSTVIAILPDTPIRVILTLIVLLLIYIVAFLNIEVFSRVGEFLIPFFLFFLGVVPILLIFSKVFNIKNLLPFLENGIQPVLNTAIFQIVNFPFGEIIVFLMYWKYVPCKKSIQNTSFFALSLATLVIVISTITSIATLGSAGASIAEIPYFNVVQRINIGDFISRLDPIAIIVLFIGGFFKMTINFYAGLMLLQSLFKIAHSRGGIIIICIIFLCFTSFYFPNLFFERWIGLKVMIPYVHSIFQIIIPLLIFLIIKIKFK
ncbi:MULTISPECIES: GerAB/ArcD/ProY family transporter [Bacillus cereus group]|uniref:GerAB/ArcD/ProY family transporter n=1 Tax=Bacillus cereus group TaxID=86661 RepID=UPI000279E6AB|nr:endospore germination permease [Bacillus cereus]EJR28585.1 spore germination protein (amino acid permease) [Bacillus cereus VD045]HDR4351015.1 endospore germination permease [Bacillus cereus]HDR6957959.1 endospore germination permease [Bacillus cereus]